MTKTIHNAQYVPGYGGRTSTMYVHCKDGTFATLTGPAADKLWAAVKGTGPAGRRIRLHPKR